MVFPFNYSAKKKLKGLNYPSKVVHVKPTWFMLVCAMLSMLSSMAKAPCCAAKACALKAPSLTAVTCVRLGAAGDDGCFFGGRLTSLTINKGVRNCFGNELFSVFFWIFFSARFPCYLQHFGAGSCRFNCLCNILELEPLIFHRIYNILVELVTFWRWKLLFQGYLQHFWVRTSHFRWNLQHFGARTVHVTW